MTRIYRALRLTKSSAFVLALFLVAVLTPLHAQTHWVGSWAASQQLVEPHNSLSADDLHRATLRQIVHLSLGGSTLRVKISNRYGRTPLRFTAVHIARPEATDSPKIVSGTDKALTFPKPRQ